MVNTTRRSGVSLVEILVVIAILAILIGLLLPAISSVRMAASHTQSVNNIRQINLGMQSLLAQNSDQIRTLPDGSKRQYRISTDQTLFTQLLPIVYPGRAQLTAESSTRDVANWLGPRVPTFISPADPLLVILDKPSSIFKYGITSYAVNQMVFDKLLLYPASITDGTSQTIALGEHYYYCESNQEYIDYTWVFAATPSDSCFGDQRTAASQVFRALRNSSGFCPSPNRCENSLSHCCKRKTLTMSANVTPGLLVSHGRSRGTAGQPWPAVAYHTIVSVGTNHAIG